jgi:sigma-70-like protein
LPALGPGGSTKQIDLLHDELGRLPEKYRDLVILCHLEGLTHHEAASRLGWPVGTVGVRLMRARELLRDRLTRRGVALAAGLLAGLSARRTAAAPPTSLVEATTRMAMDTAARAVADLASAVTRGLKLARLRAGATVLAAVAVGGLAGVSGARRLAPEDDIDARGLALANRIKDTAVRSPSIPSAQPPRAGNLDPLPAPSRGYRWVAFEDHLSGDVHQNLPKFHTWSGAILRQSGTAGACYVHQDEDGDLIVTVSHSPEPGTERLIDCRPVAYDTHRRRFDLAFERTNRCISELGDRAAVDRFRLGRHVLPSARIRSISFASRGSILASGDTDGIVRLRDACTGSELAALASRERPRHPVTLTPTAGARAPENQRARPFRRDGAGSRRRGVLFRL